MIFFLSTHPNEHSNANGNYFYLWKIRQSVESVNIFKLALLCRSSRYCYGSYKSSNLDHHKPASLAPLARDSCLTVNCRWQWDTDSGTVVIIVRGTVGLYCPTRYRVSVPLVILSQYGRIHHCPAIHPYSGDTVLRKLNVRGWQWVTGLGPATGGTANIQDVQWLDFTWMTGICFSQWYSWDNGTFMAN